MIVDNFAGGGGASLGLEWAFGRSPDIAINHDAEAIAMHAANHPETRHYCESVWNVDPVEATRGRAVDLAWFSPDCKHFSKAKGGRPVEKKIRGLAWVAVRWARAVRPRVIILENVEEFQTWGPLLKNGTPCPARKGKTFRLWRRQLERLGYEVQARELRACDYGAPTIRKRLFVIARCDGQAIVWPEATHGARTGTPWRTAAECIDWAIPCPSIFERVRPLAENTLRRIARGVWRYVINSPRPFIVPLTHRGDARVYDVDEPFRTVTGAHRGEQALVAPHIVPMQHENRPTGVDEPAQTITTQGNKLNLVAATLINTRNGEREGQAPRTRDIAEPAPTVTAQGSQGALVAALLARHYGGHENDGAQMTLPIPTITTKDHHAVVASHLVKLTGGPADHQNTAQAADEPLHTIRAVGLHFGEVRAFLVKYYGQGDGQMVLEPVHTVTTKDRFGLVTVNGEDYAIADIGMRMLTPRELFRAQGFPDSYVIDPPVNGKPLTKTAQVRMCGNSVCPQLAAALARAQFAGADQAVSA